MRTNRPKSPSRRAPFSSFLGRAFGRGGAPLRKAPRRRDIEHLEQRELLTIVGTPTNEPYFQDQWHLLAVGQNVEQPNSPTFAQSLALIDANVLGAWELGYTGAGVQVAVVDSGFDIDHEDLQFVLLAGVDPNTGDITYLDLVDQDNNPNYEDLGDGHGTAVAGLIGARDNDIGMVGVAYGADIIPIRFLPGDFDTIGTGLTQEETDRRQFVQFVGIPNPGDDGSNADQIVDIYNRSYSPISGQAAPLSAAERQALADAANLGRGTWIDIDGDGIFEPNEIRALGAINIVSSGNDSSAQFMNPFDELSGFYHSAQYNGFANSRYTIAVGALDYDGKYTNDSVGTRTMFSEAGANVLIVAPSSTQFTDIGGDPLIQAGIWTTDPTGNDGYNEGPIFGQELDDDFFVDTNYTSTFGGTSAAAPIVSGVVALMLEANPNLSYRDVQQILMMSAQQTDQFSETWITNPFSYFEDVYATPEYIYYDLDSDGDLATTEVEDAIIPNYEDPDVLRGFFDLFSQADMDLPGGNNVLTGVTVLGSTGLAAIPSTVLGWGIDASFGDQAPSGFDYLVSPISAQEKGLVGEVTASAGGFFGGFGGFSMGNGDLMFTNGAGYTMSWGYGDYLEEIGYAHGLVDAELAVRLALAWETYDLYLEEEITVTSFVVGGNGDNIRVQPRADVPLGANQFLEVPGGLSVLDIDTAYYTEFLREITTTNVQDADGNDIGSVITGAPWYDPDGDLDLASDRGLSSITIPLDPGITQDFMSVEWIEFTTEINGGGVDNLRLSLISPDGTQSELTPYRHPAGDDGATAFTIQSPEMQQAVQVPGLESLESGIGIDFFDPDFIDEVQTQQVIGVTKAEDYVEPGTAWTWTTNRHWGELLSVKAHSPEGSVATGQWQLVIENWGTDEVTFGSQFEFAIHGSEATGNRIQGKIGLDEHGNASASSHGYLAADELFNFDRNLSFGQLMIDSAGLGSGGAQTTVVLDDASDSVFYANNYYAAAHPETGQIHRYAVVDKTEYMAWAEVTKGGILAPGQDISQLTGPFISQSEALDWYFEYGAALGFDFDPNGDTFTDEQDALIWQADLEASLLSQLADAEAHQPLLNFGITLGTSLLSSSFLDLDPTDPYSDYNSSFFVSLDDAGNALQYQNFDFNQEKFASNVTVKATQYYTPYDVNGNALSRVATGEVDYFTTGADGNYYFDVEANPAPPSFATDPQAFDDWYWRWGGVFDYDISLVDEDSRILTNSANGDIGYGAVGNQGTADFDPTSKQFNVQIFASQNIDAGQMTKIDDVNFLLTPPPTTTTVSGLVFSDLDGNGQLNGSETPAAGVLVYYDSDGVAGLSSGDIQATTNAQGQYSFEIINPIAGQVVQVHAALSTLPDGTEFFNPSAAPGADASQNISLVVDGSVTANFTITPDGFVPGVSGVISGVVFQDVNGNGTQNAGEGTIPNVRVYVDADGNNAYDAGELFSLTNTQGAFTITTPSGGTYSVRVDTTALGGLDYEQTSPAGGASITASLSNGEEANGLTFGLRSLLVQDYGDLFVDATHNYPTLLADDGARHVVVATGPSRVYLGAGVDIDADGRTSTDATGDDFHNTDDEDGVVLVSDIVAGQTFQIDIAATGQGALLNAWIDFNDDGDWDDAGEQILIDRNFISGTTNRYTISAPVGTVEADFYAARFRVGPFGLSYTGAANIGEVEDYMLPRSRQISIGGTVRQDADGGRIFDANDTPVSGVTVYHDANLDGVRQAGEVSATTNANGQYNLVLVTTTPTNVNIRIDNTTLPSGVTTISPVDGIFNQTLNPGQMVTSNFLVGAPQGVSGNVYSDANNNGAKNVGEGGLAGVTVNLYNDNIVDGVFATLVGTAVTDANGNYFIPTTSAGDFEARLDLSGMEFVFQTEPNSGGRVGDVTPGAIVAVGNFGVFNQAATFTEDYGDLFVDASHNYPTTSGQDGARHTVTPGIYLGSGVDADPGTLTSTDASADDASIGDDEDGVVLVSSMIEANSTIEIDVTATGPAGTTLDAWIDFNDDGDWDDAGERIATGLALTSGVTTRLVVATPANVAGPLTLLASRFRWGPGTVGYAGQSAGGEVEDHLFSTGNNINTGGNLDGDINGDSVVDILDLDVLSSNFGSTSATRAEGDLNGDSNVDILDLDILSSNFGASAPALALATQSSGQEPHEVINLAAGEGSLLSSDAQTAGIDPPGTPKLVLHGPASIDVDQAFSPVLLTAEFSSSVHETSFAVEEEESTPGDDALQAALLQWSLEGPSSELAEEIESSLGEESQEDEQELAFSIGDAFLSV